LFKANNGARGLAAAGPTLSTTRCYFGCFRCSATSAPLKHPLSKSTDWKLFWIFSAFRFLAGRWRRQTNVSARRPLRFTNSWCSFLEMKNSWSSPLQLRTTNLDHIWIVLIRSQRKDTLRTISLLHNIYRANFRISEAYFCEDSSYRQCMDLVEANICNHKNAVRKGDSKFEFLACKNSCQISLIDWKYIYSRSFRCWVRLFLPNASTDRATTTELALLSSPRALETLLKQLSLISRKIQN